MKIWCVEIGEPLPIESGVRLHRYGLFTKYLAKQGHDVVWYTSSFSHAPKKNFVERDTDILLEGVRIKFLWGNGYKKNVSFDRILHNKNFSRKLTNEFRKAEELPDLIIAPIPIMENAKVIHDFCLEKNIPFVVDIRDRWPDDLANLLPRFLRPLGRLALFNSYQTMKKVCSGAKFISAVSKAEVQYGLSFANRSATPLDAPFYLGYEAPPQQPLSEEVILSNLKNLNIDPSMPTVCFFGTIGRFFDLSTVVKVARDLPDIQFVLAGAGDSLEKYKNEAEDLKNVIFPGWCNKLEIQSIMSLSFAGLAPYKKTATMTMPNKPFEYMSGGLCIISSIQGELKDYLDAYNCGLTYKADNADELKAHILKLRSDNILCSEMGRNARNLLEDKFLIASTFKEMESRLLQITNQNKIQFNPKEKDGISNSTEDLNI